jgi:hypothetical protein
LAENIHVLQGNTEAPLDANNEAPLEENSKETKHVSMSRLQNVQQDHNTKRAGRFTENVAQFRCEGKARNKIVFIRKLIDN